MTERIKHFLDADGRVKQFPAKRKMKNCVLFYLAQKFEPGKRYTEREVNDLLLLWHTFGDPATLRRELYDYRFLDRSVDGYSYQLSDVQPRLEELMGENQ